MRKVRLGIVDYGMGNINSVSKALERVGAAVFLIDRPQQMKRVDGVVLPGVGAFSCAVNNLKKRKLFEPIGKWIVQEKPFLGICLGYQLLFEESEEGGRIPGFGIFAGKVKKFPEEKNLKVPHMGWNQVKRVESLEFRVERLKSKDQCQMSLDSKLNSLNSKLFSGIPDNSYFYFLHSYFPVPRQKEIICTYTTYGLTFASSILKKNLFACQFHPEKSGELGLQLLKNFITKI